MVSKLMHVTPSKCTACRNCEMACAFSHMHQGRPTTARIRAFADGEQREGHNAVVVCMQCEDAGCVKACPAHALWRNPETGAIYHVPDRCIRCQSCVAGCSFGNMRWEAAMEFPTKCDLCDGDPVCVKFCPTAAIEYR
jgi:anaerobic carbon-monoxide dehydrogenase iron sulfur subunit